MQYPSIVKVLWLGFISGFTYSLLDTIPSFVSLLVLAVYMLSVVSLVNYSDGGIPERHDV